MRTDQLTGVTVFLKVADRRSFTAAAAELGISPSAASQVVKALERRVGVPLLARTTRAVALTEAGLRFRERCVPAVEEIAAAFDSAADFSRQPSGLLRLTVPRIALPALIAPTLAAFLRAHPKVQLEISVDDRTVNIVEEGFDAGIRFGELIEKDMVAVRLTPPFRMAIAGTRRYFARHGRPRVPEDLAAHDCIRYRLGTSGAIYRWEFERDGKAIEIGVAGPIIANDTDLMLRAALDGVGLCYLTRPMAAPHVRAGRLETVLDRYCPETPGFFIYFPGRAQAMLKLRAFIDFVRSQRPMTAASGRRSVK